MATVIIVTGEHDVRYFPLGRRTNVVGRSESLIIQVLDDQVSRKHCQIRYVSDRDRYHLLDMHSRNGTLINGRLIEEETPLNDGDYIQIGNTELLYTHEDFDDAEMALHHYKKVGERGRPTFMN